jgi:O-antigen ligase
VSAPGNTAALERYAFIALAGSLGAIQLKIGGFEVLFVLSAIAWLVLLAKGRPQPRRPAFVLPLLVYAGLTFVSTAFSQDVLKSLVDDKQFIWYLVVPVTMFLARGRRATTVTNTIIAVGALSAFVGLVQGIVIGGLSSDFLLHHRPHGLIGHFMTYSGLLMLVACTAVAQLLYREREWIWPAVAVPALLVALAVTLSRNVWIGTLAAITVMLVMRRPKLTLVVPVVIAAALVVPSVRARALSMFDAPNPTNRDRISMWKSGGAMIADHWLTGVGPNMVPDAYLRQYKRPDAVDPPDQPGSTRAHLHNVVIQIAAERGVPALLAWLWFLGVAARDLWRQARGGPAPGLAAAGLAAIVAMLAAGMFEHNFGDSEFLVLFLGLITLPFAARAADR